MHVLANSVLMTHTPSINNFYDYFIGFHDAIGDAVTLSLTPKHLQGLGLIQKSVDDTAHDINFLFAMAMDKVSLNAINILVSHSPSYH